MPQDLRKSIIIVDRSRSAGYSLRNSLQSQGVTAHVFNSYPAALALLDSKTIHTVFIEFEIDEATMAFYDAVKTTGVSIVFTPTAIEPDDLRQYGFDVRFPAPQPPRSLLDSFEPKGRPPRRREPGSNAA